MKIGSFPPSTNPAKTSPYSNSPSPPQSKIQNPTNLPDRLLEARQLAEEALAIRQTLDPAAVKIWNTYTVLADIADRQQQPDQAQTYRQQARQSKAAFAGTRYELQKFSPLINAVVAATADPAVRQELEADLEDLEQKGWQNLVAAIRRIWTGDRDEDMLCASLDLDDSMVMMAIVGGIGDRGRWRR